MGGGSPTNEGRSDYGSELLLSTSDIPARRSDAGVGGLQACRAYGLDRDP